MRLSDGSIVNVMSELELEGDEDICTQLMKLSEDNSNDPEQELFEVLVVTEVESIASEKVTEMLSLIKTPLWLSVGEIEETVGAVVSVVVVVSSVVPEASSILLESRPSSLVLSWPQECRNITNRIKKEIVRNELIFINSPIILKFSVPL